MKKWFCSILGSACMFVLIPSLHAQAVYTAERHTRIEAGGGFLYLNNDYTTRANYGATAWGDFDFLRVKKLLVGVEGEGHFSSIYSPDDLIENTYLVGPKVSFRRNKLTVFGKLMVGRGSIQETFYYTYRTPYVAQGTYNIYAFGGGAEYRLTRRLNLRPIDLEIQKWPDFSPHTLSPIAASVGVSYIIR